MAYMEQNKKLALKKKGKQESSAFFKKINREKVRRAAGE
jgi:DNA excision repair protein ERCC-3